MWRSAINVAHVAEAECQNRCAQLSQQCKDAHTQLQQLTARLHIAERQARRASSGVPAAALRAAARTGTGMPRSSSGSELHMHVAVDGRPSTSAGALERRAPDPGFPTSAHVTEGHEREQQVRSLIVKVMFLAATSAALSCHAWLLLEKRALSYLCDRTALVRPTVIGLAYRCS